MKSTSLLRKTSSNRMDSLTNDGSLTTVETITSLNYILDSLKTTTTKTTSQDEQSQRRTLIMVLWVSVVFSTSRFVFAISNLILLLLQDSVYNWWATGFNFFYASCVYGSYFFVYMKTNKLFRKTFYQIFLRKNNVDS